MIKVYVRHSKEMPIAGQPSKVIIECDRHPENAIVWGTKEQAEPPICEECAHANLMRSHGGMAVVFSLTTHPADGNEWHGTHDVPGCRHDRRSVTGTFPGGLSFMHSARRVANAVADRALLRLNDDRSALSSVL